MQSPKFKFLKKELEDVFTAKLLKEEWKKRVRYQIRKQLIFDPVEYRDINEKIDTLSIKIKLEISKGEYKVNKPSRYLVEKSRGLCRQMTLVHPADLLVLERLSRSIYFELKSKAPSKSAFFEPDDGNFKNAFSKGGGEYGSFASWKKFQKEVFGFTRENRYIIITDVANFYDFINFQHLRNIISSLADIRESVLDLLIHLLNRLTWTPDFMPLTQVGMPQIETTATRVLANAMLFEVDKIGEGFSKTNYARFMDDIDIGVQNIPQAKCIVRDIDLTLQSRQLRLNSSKTKILTRKEAFEHFCIQENTFMARLEALIEKNSHEKLLSIAALNKYEKLMQRDGNGLIGKDSAFRFGNGSKIHKRIFGLLYKLKVPIPDKDLLWLIKNDPAMRETAFRWLGNSRKNNTNLSSVINYFQRGISVDDAAVVNICGYMLHAKFRYTSKCVSIARNYCFEAANGSDIGLHCAIMVASKFTDKKFLLELLSDNKERISADFWLARAAGGVSPRFLGSGLNWNVYQDTISEIDNSDTFDVLNYMLMLASSGSFSQSLKYYLTANNGSFPQDVYFPKVLCLLAASKNPSIGSIMPDMYKIHPALKADRFFGAMGFK